MRVFDVVGFGALNLDELYTVERLLSDDEGQIITAGAYPGGSAANTIYALAKLGLRAGFLGAVGDDEAGKILLESFESVGVDTSRIVIKAKAKTGRALGFIDAQGNRTLYIEPGANSLLCQPDIDLAYASRARLVHLTSFVDRKQLALQRELVRSLPARCSVSFAPGALLARRSLRVLRPIFKRTHVLFVNRRELELLTSTDDLASGTQRLLEAGPAIVVVTLGAEGSYVTDGTHAHRLEALCLNRIVDTTGAGDAFAAGFLYGLIQKKKLAECARLGVQMARCALTKVGARSGLPTLDELKSHAGVSQIIPSATSGA